MLFLSLVGHLGQTWARDLRAADQNDQTRADHERSHNYKVIDGQRRAEEIPAGALEAAPFTMDVVSLPPSGYSPARRASRSETGLAFA
jgi:hypothetical protein